MNIESLETFIILAENGNFTKTAEIQYVVQSTISNRISELEKYVGKDLLIRNNKTVKLTKAGETFLPYAKRILMLKKDGIVKARSADIYEDRLSLGVQDAIYKGIISRVIKEYFLKFPKIAIKLTINHSEEIIKLLGDEILDVAFVYSKPKSNKFEIFDFFNDEIILVTSTKNAAIFKDSTCFKDFLTIYKENCIPLLYADLGEEFFNWLSELLGDSPLLRLSVDEVSHVTDFVKEGFGYAFVTKSSVRKELEDGILVHIQIKDLIPPSRKIYMLINKSKKDSIAISNWIENIHRFV